MITNLLFVGATFAVFLGTVFPVISEALRGAKITLAATWFNHVVGPIFLAIILLAGLCALMGWRRTSVNSLKRSFLWPLVGALVLGVVYFIFGAKQPVALLAFVLCSFVIFVIFYEWFRGTVTRHKMRSENYLKAFVGLIWANRSRYGGYIVHIGIVLIAIGVVGSSFFSVTKEVTLIPGKSTSIDNYTLTYLSRSNPIVPNKEVASATLSVSRNGKVLGDMTPVAFYDNNWNMQATNVAIKAGLAGDLYVIPAVNWDATNKSWDWDYTNNAVSFKLIVNPLVDWIWIGGIVLFLGAVIALWPQKQILPAQNHEGQTENTRKMVKGNSQGKRQLAKGRAETQPGNVGGSKKR